MDDIQAFIDKCTDQENRGAPKHTKEYYEKRFAGKHDTFLKNREKAIDQKSIKAIAKTTLDAAEEQPFEIPPFDTAKLPLPGREAKELYEPVEEPYENPLRGGKADYQDNDSHSESSVDDSAIIARRSRLRWFLAREQGDGFKEMMKKIKAIKVDKMDSDQLDMAEQALALLTYNKWIGGAAHNCSRVATNVTTNTLAVKGLVPPRGVESVHAAVQADGPLHEDIALLIGYYAYNLPTIARIGLSFASDVASAYAYPREGQGGPGI